MNVQFWIKCVFVFSKEVMNDTLEIPCVPLVPSPVKDIGISAQTNSLLISWSHGSGNVERYQLMLMDKGILVNGTIVNKHATSYTFHGLTPGHLYNLTIVTEAAGLQSHKWKMARTSKFPS